MSAHLSTLFGGKTIATESEYRNHVLGWRQNNFYMDREKAKQERNPKKSTIKDQKLEEKLQKMKKENENLEQKLILKEEIIEKLEESLEIEKLRKHFEDDLKQQKDQEIQNLKKELEEVKARKDTYSRALQTSLADKIALELENKNIKAELTELKKEHTSLASSFQGAFQVVQEAIESSKQLQKELQDYKDYGFRQISTNLKLTEKFDGLNFELYEARPLPQNKDFEIQLLKEQLEGKKMELKQAKRDLRNKDLEIILLNEKSKKKLAQSQVTEIPTMIDCITVPMTETEDPKYERLKQKFQSLQKSVEDMKQLMEFYKTIVSRCSRW